MAKAPRGRNIPLLLRLPVHAAAVWLALFLMFHWFEDKILYHPVREILETPAERGMAHEDVFLRADDGVAVHAWWIPARESPESAPVILAFHGNAENISFAMDQHALFHQEGWSLFLPDYRGYGRSEGRPSERGLHRDAGAAYRHLTRERGVAPEQIVLYGRSLGGAVALRLAADVPVAGVVTEGAFAHTHEAARDILPWLPPALFIKKRFDSLSCAAEIRAPKLFLHAEHDEIIPVRHARLLHAAAAPPKELALLPAGGHNDVFYASTDAFLARFRAFVAACVAPEKNPHKSP